MKTVPSKTGGSLRSIVDKGLFQTAYHTYHDFWMSLARSAGLTDAEGEEIIHSILLPLLEHPELRFTSLAHVRNYVARSILNEVQESKKMDARKDEWDDESELSAREDVAFYEQERLELRNILRESIRTLPPHLYQIVKLRFFSGFTFQEISALLGVSISTLKSREDAALERIRKSMRSSGV